MMGEKPNFGEVIKEECECDPMTGTGKRLAREIPCSNEKSVVQKRQFTVNIEGGKTEHVVKSDIHSNVLSALRSNKVLFNKIDRMKEKEKVLYLIGNTGIKGCINLGMPLKYLPEGSNVEMKFYKVKKNEITDPYRQYGDGKEDCILFYICPIGYKLDTPGAQNERIIRCKEIDKNCYMYIFAPEGETIKNALHNDGRFLPLLAHSEWSLIEGNKRYYNDMPIDKSLCDKRFEVGLASRNIKGKHKDQNLLAPHEVKTESLAKTCDVPNKQVSNALLEAKTESQAKTYSNKEEASLASQDHLKMLMSALLQQYPCFMEQNKIISSSFGKTRAGKRQQKAFLTACKEEFGKVTKNSILIKMQRKLNDLSESVGYIVWGTTAKEGCATCFVLCNSYILTCHHVLNMIVGEGIDEKQWANKISQSASVIFSYEDKHPKDRDSVSLEPWLGISDRQLDFAVLKLKANGTRIPPGLVQLSSPPPFNGLVYIIGHPNGEAKSLDGCSVISVMQRQQDLSWRRLQRGDCNSLNCGYEDRGINCVHIYTPNSFSGIINNSDIVTYDTCFFSGSSGSPVFDQNGKLVALHTAGYSYGDEEKKCSIIEFGFSMLSILSEIEKKDKRWYKSEIACYLQNCPDGAEATLPSNGSDVEMEDLD